MARAGRQKLVKRRKPFSGERTHGPQLKVEGFDFLGCHLHKRLSGRIWERERKRLYFLHRWPSRRAMLRVRQGVRERTPRSRCHADLRKVIADLNPVLRGWGNYFRTGNAARQFVSLDEYLIRRLRSLRLARKGRHLRPGESSGWTREYFEHLGLHRLRASICYPERAFWQENALCCVPTDHWQAVCGQSACTV